MAAEKKEEEAADVKVVEDKVQVGGQKSGPPILTFVLFLINTIFNAGIAFLVWKNIQAQKQKETVQDVVDGMKHGEEGKDAAHGTAAPEGGHGEAKAGHGGADSHKLLDIVLQPVDTFVVNLTGDSGARYVKIDMELELNDSNVSAELEKRKPQIRDIIITLLSSKSYEQIDSSEDKEFLREEIKNTINGFLITGKVLKVYFSQFIVS